MSSPADHSPESLQHLVAVARGDEAADLLITGAKVFDVFTREWLETDVAIAGDRIAGMGTREARATFDAAGRFLTPGLMDAHVHIESSKVMPAAFADAVTVHGTTGIVADPHEIANALGAEGVSWFADACRNLPLDVHLMAPTCVPASSLESPRGALDASDLARLLDVDGVHGLGEMMNFPAVIAADDAEVAKVLAAQGRPVDGHAPGITGYDLDAYVAAGITTDHECTTVDEAIDRRRRGMWVLLREASTARNLIDLLPMVRQYGPEFCALCTDDREPDMLIDEGHINQMLRVCVANGVSAEDALVMATINVARCHGLGHVGAIAPGWVANLALFDDITEFTSPTVWHRGTQVANGARPSTVTASSDVPEWVTQSVNAAPVTAADLAVHSSLGTDEPVDVTVIEVVAHQLINRRHTWTTTPDGALIAADAYADIAKLSCIERHHATGRIGTGFVTGLGLARGAFATTIAHDAHNIMCVGVNDDDMVVAIDWLREHNGGVVAVDNGAVTASLHLPIGGLLTTTSAAETAEGMTVVNDAVAALGATIPEPVMVLNFLGLSVIPELRVTDRGLVDVTAATVLPLMTASKTGVS